MPSRAERARRLVRAAAVGAVLAVLLSAAARAGGDDGTNWLDATLPGFGEVRVAVVEQPDASPPSAEIILQGRDGQPVYRFPPLPGSESWAYVGTDGLTLADVDRDGRQDVVAVVEMMTGIGPGGAEPFKVGAVYLRRGDGFAADRKLDEKLNEAPLRDQWSDAATLAEVAGKNVASSRQ